MIPFLVQVAGVVLAAGLCVSMTWPLVVRLSSGLSAVRLADSLVVAGVLPMLVAVGLAVALVVPTALDLSGVHPDHCHAHDHGLHLCGVHGDVHSPLMALGVVLLTIASVRGVALGTRLWRASSDIATLGSMGTRRGALVEVPGEVALCHATGVIRPRVLLSAGLRVRLGVPAIDAALAHEYAHLRRRDPAVLVLLQFASIFGLPTLGLTTAFRAAADEAADAEAAAEVGAITVAEALVRLARIVNERSAPPSPVALAFGAHPLERRVELLLGGPLSPEKARGLSLSVAVAIAVLLLGAIGAEPIHHLVEDLLLSRH